MRHGNHHFLLGIAVVTALMAGFGTYLIFTDGFGYLVGVGFFVLVSALALRSWRTTGVSLKLAEENPRPPTSPDPDPHHVPVAGFTRSSVS